MPEQKKVVINLATGLEDAERVTVAFLVAGDGCPPLPRLFDQFIEGGGELLVCPICFNSRKLEEEHLVPGARIAGATPLWEWIGDEPAEVFSY